MIKNILITGGAGYIGSHVAEILIKNKKRVIILDNLSTGFKKLINKKAKFFKADIKNTKKINQILNKHKIDVVIHLAANLLIGEGQKYPKKYFTNNVLGTMNTESPIKSNLYSEIPSIVVKMILEAKKYLSLNQDMPAIVTQKED